MRLRRTRSATRRRAATLTVVLALTAAVAIAASPASATGQPVPPFEDETWLINITHTDEYWLNVRYNVFRPGWSYADQEYSGAHVTGHSGCGEVSPPLLVNAAYAAEGKHEIIVYWGGYCAHDGDKGDETKYDDFPDGTPIAVSATLERYLPGETAPSQTSSATETVIVSGEAAPPVSLGSIAVDRSDPQAGAAASDTSSSTTSSDQDAAAEDLEGAATGIDSDVGPDETAVSSTGDKGTARWIAGLIIAVGLALGVAAAVLLFKKIFDRRTPLEAAPRAREARKSAAESTVAASQWFAKQATHAIEAGGVVYVASPGLVARAQAEGVEAAQAMAAPLPQGVELVPTDPKSQDKERPFVRARVRDGITVFCDPDNPDLAVLSTGAQVLVDPDSLIPLPSGGFAPTRELTGTEGVEGRSGDRVVLYDPGTPVQLLTTTGDQSLVRIADNTDIWVPRSSVGDATAQIDPPSAPTPSG